MARAPRENSEQPGQLRSLIRVFAVRLKGLSQLYADSEDSDHTEPDTDLSLRWADMPLYSFCCFTSQINNRTHVPGRCPLCGRRMATNLKPSQGQGQWGQCSLVP